MWDSGWVCSGWCQPHPVGCGLGALLGQYSAQLFHTPEGIYHWLCLWLVSACASAMPEVFSCWFRDGLVDCQLHVTMSVSKDGTSGSSVVCPQSVRKGDSHHQALGLQLLPPQSHSAGPSSWAVPGRTGREELPRSGRELHPRACRWSVLTSVLSDSSCWRQRASCASLLATDRSERQARELTLGPEDRGHVVLCNFPLPVPLMRKVCV